MVEFKNCIFPQGNLGEHKSNMLSQKYHTHLKDASFGNLKRDQNDWKTHL